MLDDPKEGDLTLRDQGVDITDKIIRSDQEAFNRWAGNPDNAKRLDIPNEALRYLFIPARVLELVEDPIAIDIVVSYRSRVGLRLFVIEHRGSPVTDNDSLERYRQEVARLEEEAFAQTSATGSIHRITYPELPPDVDKYHATPEAEALIEAGALTLNDYVINEYSLSLDSVNRDFDCLIMGDYEDREEFRGKGIGTSFFRRLHDAAKQMGFRFIEGINNEKNIGFFTGVLGRSTIVEVKPELRNKFKPQESKKLEEITVDFLYPEDKKEFLE